MSKLYYTNLYEKDFTAEILSITEKEGAFHIVLNQTAFYPEGGGQPSDTGFIEDCPITYVYEENEIIYHVSSKKPIKIHKVKCTIDWSRRFDHMQHHLAQHLLSALLLEHFDTQTLSFHLGTETCTIDLDKKLSSWDILRVEGLANELISENIEVKTFYPTKQELKKLPLRKPLPKIVGPLRLVQIGELDLNACCGLHPYSTLELQMVKLLKQEKHKLGNRLTFIAGARAVKNALVASQETLHQIEHLTKECHALTTENRKLNGLLTDFKVKELIQESPLLGDIRLVKMVYEDITPKALQTLGAKLTAYEKVIALLGLKEDKTTHLVFMCSRDIKKISMNNLLKDSITLIDGQGGGNDFSAQGGGKSANNLEPCLDYALMKIKAMIG